MGNLQIDIFGTSFAIKADAETEYLNKLLKYYKDLSEDVESNGDLKDPLKISILTGIMMCDELYKEKYKNIKIQNAVQNNSSDEEANRITSMLIEKLDKVLK